MPGQKDMEKGRGTGPQLSSLTAEMQTGYAKELETRQAQAGKTAQKAVHLSWASALFLQKRVVILWLYCGPRAGS